MAGSAGCLPANRRSADPSARVRLLEGDRATGISGRGYAIVWFGRRAVYLYIRGQHENSDDWAERSAVEWNCQSVLPVFNRSERYTPLANDLDAVKRFLRQHDRP